MAAKYPNQFTIIFGNKMLADKTHPYTLMNSVALQNAMNDLKPAGLKMWLYLVTLMDEKDYGLSPKACQDWGIKKDSYYTGKDELIEKGYLRQVGSSKFQFDYQPILINTSQEFVIESGQQEVEQQTVQQSVWDF